MWELGHKESWVLKNWCFQIVVLEKTTESPLDCKAIKQVNPKRNQSCIFIGKTCWSSNTLVTWCEELTHWKRPWYWERWRAGGEGSNRDGWVASSTQRTVKDREVWHAAVCRVAKSQTQLSNWTTYPSNIGKNKGKIILYFFKQIDKPASQVLLMQSNKSKHINIVKFKVFLK